MGSTRQWHDSRNAPGVTKLWLVAIVTFGALPSAVAAQPWADAYKAGEYAKAASLLQPIAVEQVQSMGDGQNSDPAPARHLALLYARGSGVERDAILACTLAQLSDMASRQVPYRGTTAADYTAYQASIDESERFVHAHCGPLTDRQRLAASRSLGCFAFGLHEGTVTLGEQTVWVDRIGLRLAPSEPDPLASDTWCSQLVARLGTRTVAPPADAAPSVVPRSFVELLGWQAVHMADDPSVRYVLSWTMFELRGKKLEPVAMEHLLSASTWPRAALPPDFDARFSVEMIRSGHIRWRLDGAPPKRGWIMLPEGEPR
jgi:hypothetical protein